MAQNNQETLLDISKIEYVNLSDLVPDTANARKHSDRNVEEVARSIREFGQHAPLVVQEGTNRILVGNCRYEAMMSLGWEKAAVYYVNDDNIQAVRRSLADNRTSELAEWNDDILKELLESLGPDDLDIPGWNEDELEAMLGIADFGEPGEAVEDDFDAEPPAEPVSKPGDLWILGRHRLLCGDSTKREDVERLMDGKKADMVLTDPPYGMYLDTDWSSAKSSLKFATEKNALGGKKHRQVIGDHDDFTPELINAVFANFGYCKEIFLWGADYYAELLQGRNDGSWIVWDKRLDDSADKMYGSCFELCWSKRKHKREIARIKWAGIFGTEQEFDHKRSHPTQKPTILSRWFIGKYSDEYGLIVDIYGGSGSTLIACEQLNRQCYMMEIDPGYCDVIVNRWEQFTGEKATLITGSTDHR